MVQFFQSITLLALQAILDDDHLGYRCYIGNTNTECIQQWFNRSLKPAWAQYKAEHIPAEDRHKARLMILLDRSKPHDAFAKHHYGRLEDDIWTSPIPAGGTKYVLTAMARAVKFLRTSARLVGLSRGL